MQTEQGNMLQSLRNVAGFLDQHADRLSDVVQAGARQRLNAAIRELESFASEQSGAHLDAKGATQKYQALRRALVRDHMLPVARIAVADLPDTPELHPFRLPHGRPSPQRLAAAAHGMAAAAAKFAGVFTSAGLPDDFIAQLTAASDRMIASLGERDRSRVTRRGATEGLRSRLQTGRRIVRVLDALVRRALVSDSVLLESWKAATRIQRIGGNRQSGGTPTPTATPTAAAA